LARTEKSHKNQSNVTIAIKPHYLSVSVSMITFDTGPTKQN